MATRKVNTEFTVTGEEKLRRAITEINNGAKVLKSEMNKLTAEYDGNTDSAEFLTQKYDILERQMLTQKDKVEALKQAVFKILSTERFEYVIYSRNYGTELNFRQLLLYSASSNRK